MKKKNRQLTGGAIILFILTAALIMTELPKKTEQITENSTEAPPALVQWNSESVVSLTLGRGLKQWSAYRVEQSWDVPSLNDKQYETSKLDRLVLTLSGLYADQPVNTEDPALFGLADPVLEFSVKLENGEEYSYALGNKTVSGTGFYFKDISEDRMYIVPSYAASSFLISEHDLREKRLLTFDPATVTALTYNSSEVSYTLERSTPTGDPGADMFPWKLEGLYKNVQAAGTEKIETILGNVVQNLVKTGFTEDDARALREYGLYARDRSELILKGSEGNELILYLGKTNGSGQIYALIKDSKDVFTVNESLIQNLTPDAWEIIDHFLHIPFIDDVRDITLVSEQGEKTLTLTPEYKLNNSVIEEDEAKKIYQKLISLQLEGEAETGKSWKSKETPVITLRYTYTADRADDILRFSEFNKDFYLVYRNDWGRFLVGKYQLEELLKAL